MRRDRAGRRHVAEIGVVTTRRDAAGLDLRVETAWSAGADDNGGSPPGRAILDALLRSRISSAPGTEEE